MAFDEKLAERIRTYLTLQSVTEKRMFGSLCFMVGSKMCVCAGDRRILCRLSLDDAAAAIKKEGIEPMVMNGHLSKHYVYINHSLLESDIDFSYWMEKALEFNRSLVRS